MLWAKIRSVWPAFGLRGKVVLCALLLGLVPVTLGTLAVFELAAGRIPHDAREKLQVLTESAVSTATERRDRLTGLAVHLSRRADLIARLRLDGTGVPPSVDTELISAEVTPVNHDTTREFVLESLQSTEQGTQAVLAGPLIDTDGALVGRYRGTLRTPWLVELITRTEVLETRSRLLTSTDGILIGSELTSGEPLRLRDALLHPTRRTGPTTLYLTAGHRDWVVCLAPVPSTILRVTNWWVASVAPAAAIEGGLGALTFKALLVGLLFLLFLCLGTFLLADSVVRPIRRLIGRIESEAPGIQVDQGGDEVRALDHALEQMIAVRRRDHATLSNRQEFLDGVLAQSEELDQLKDSFLSSVSHELRTPITCIKSYAEILSTYDDLDGTQRQEFLEIILHESERLARLINDLLDLSKLEAGRMPLTVEDLDLLPVAASALRTLEVLAQRGEIKLDLRIPEHTRVLGDRDRITQVFVNLLSNAIKFTPRRGTVTLECEALAGQIETRVIDTGPGVPSAYLDKVFEKFFQVQQDNGGEGPKGTGLGLPICREIVTRLGGEIGVRLGAGGGSVFWFRLPAVPAPATAATPRDLAQSEHEKLAALFSAAR